MYRHIAVDGSARERYGGVKAALESAQAGGESAELLEVAEAAFDAIALPVDDAVVVAMDFTDPVIRCSTVTCSSTRTKA